MQPGLFSQQGTATVLATRRPTPGRSRASVTVNLGAAGDEVAQVAVAELPKERSRIDSIRFVRFWLAIVKSQAM